MQYSLPSIFFIITIFVGYREALYCYYFFGYW